MGKIAVTLPDGRQGKGEEVSVTESTERWSDFRLADGTLLRMKCTVVSAVRVENEFDGEGNPLYMAKAQPITAIGDVPQELKRSRGN